MFSKAITNSSNFLMMPATSQALYYHLGMNADDDGYCEHFMVMRMTESKPDDLKILEAKGLVHVFDDKVLIIRDWKEHNHIQADRYHPSKYLSVYSLDTVCIQDVSIMDTEVRLGKVRLGKVSKALKKEKQVQLTDPEWIATLKNNPAYQHIDIAYELDKMEAWLTLPKNKARKKTKQFILNWLNKIDRPLKASHEKTISKDDILKFSQYSDSIMDFHCNCIQPGKEYIVEAYTKNTDFPFYKELPRTPKEWEKFILELKPA